MSDPTNNQVLAELQEDYRREQFKEWMRHYGGLVMGLAVLAVAATAGYSFWQHRDQAQKQAVTAELYKNIKSPDELKAFADSHAGTGQAALALMIAANLDAQAGNGQAAMERYQAVIDSKEADEAMKAAATMNYVEAGLEAGVAAIELQTKLEPYQAADNAFRFTAWQLGALVAHKAGDHERAQMLLSQLLNDQAAPAPIKARAAELQRVL